MAASVPVFKFVLLGVRQAARPLARIGVKSAENHPVFRKVCIDTVRWVDLQSKRLARPLKGPVSVGPELEKLSEQQALEQGCMMLGEAFVYMVTGAALYYEYNRAKEADRAKASAARDAVAEHCDQLVSERYECLRHTLEAMQAENDAQKILLESLNAEVLQLRRQLDSPVTGGWAAWFRRRQPPE
eukprot:TRINITY_DN77283_c0_g1_i1.p1 TRINITY_DN77283_c0_g1~~TRINITY_DN77283_c0_g1_i1.p1  ORF type:complete len:205 (+),score=40.58 TRINITY_DN77283_c0_g1_i1:58-615(+)